MSTTMRNLRLAAITALAAACLVPAVSTSASADSWGPYVIHNIVTDMCVDIPGYGRGTLDGPVTQYYCDKSTRDNQRFWEDVQADGHVMFRNVLDGYCLDLPGYGAVDAGTRISEYHCRAGHDGDNQEFIPDGRLFRHVNNPDLCLDVEGYGDRSPDVHLGLYYCDTSRSDDHLWELLPAAS